MLRHGAKIVSQRQYVLSEVKNVSDKRRIYIGDIVICSLLI